MPQLLRAGAPLGQRRAHRVRERGLALPARRIIPAILTASPASRALLRQARRYAAVDATVLVTGETGVGKDTVARYIHAAGPRRRDPFVVVDCPAIPATLVEAEFFGHEPGAFTDATVARAGRFEQAGRGTLYLDAITGLNPSGQGALLRLVEERRVTRLGGRGAIDVHARIIASADASLEERVASGEFRPELFHRLRVLPLHVPPLRERRDDILPLAARFVADIAQRLRRAAPTIGSDAEDALLRYHWPGNVRELHHVLERVLLSHTGDRLSARDLPLEVIEGRDAVFAATTGQPATLDEVERRYIALTLQRTAGNQTRAAAILGISRKSLWEKRRRYGLD